VVEKTLLYTGKLGKGKRNNRDFLGECQWIGKNTDGNTFIGGIGILIKNKLFRISNQLLNDSVTLKYA